MSAQPTPEKVHELVKPGTLWRVFYRQKDSRNKVLHVRAVVDGRFVVCWYAAGHGWRYALYSVWDFVYDIESERLAQVKPSKAQRLRIEQSATYGVLQS